MAPRGIPVISSSTVPPAGDIYWKIFTAEENSLKQCHIRGNKTLRIFTNLLPLATWCIVLPLQPFLPALPFIHSCPFLHFSSRACTLSFQESPPVLLGNGTMRVAVSECDQVLEGVFVTYLLGHRTSCQALSCQRCICQSWSPRSPPALHLKGRYGKQTESKRAYSLITEQRVARAATSV